MSGPALLNCRELNTQTYAAKEALPVIKTLFWETPPDCVDEVMVIVRSPKSAGR
jgi:hypothetical protein